MSANKKQQGFSFVELLIAMAILSVVSFFTVGTCNRENRSATQLTARSNVQKEVDQLFALIRRDQKFQIAGGSKILGSGLGFEVTRISPGQDDPTVTYTVQFQSVCLPAVPVGKDFAASYSDSYRSQVNDSDNKCLALLNCQASEYPAVAIKVVSGAMAPQYTPDLYPTIGKSFSTSAAGMALCAENQGTHFQISAEAIASRGDPGAFIPVIMKRSLSLPANGASGLTLLPN